MKNGLAGDLKTQRHLKWQDMPPDPDRDEPSDISAFKVGAKIAIQYLFGEFEGH